MVRTTFYIVLAPTFLLRRFLVAVVFACCPWWSLADGAGSGVEERCNATAGCDLCVLLNDATVSVVVLATDVTLSGTCVIDNSKVTLRGEASSGGLWEVSGSGTGSVFHVQGDADFTVLDVMVTGGHNPSGNGGGFFVQGTAHVTLAGRTNVTGNEANDRNGGGFYVGDSARVTVAGMATVAGNTAYVRG